MSLLERLGWSKAVEFITFYDWIIEKGKTIEDLRTELNIENARIASERQENEDNYVAERRKLKEKGIQIDWCNKCDFPLTAIESLKEDCEAELKCPKCDYSKCLEISLADYRLSINNKLYPENEMQLKPGENRVSAEKRKRRRAICLSCEYLRGKHCKRCGCSIKHRTYYDILDCPDKRW